ncbi:MAG: PLD nuclease N-terminal domain-containing protein [Thermodesulfovibrionia bacterium]
MFGFSPAETVTIIFLLFIFCVSIILWIIAILDIIYDEFTVSKKIIWILVVIFLPVIGACLYFFIGKKENSISIRKV